MDAIEDFPGPISHNLRGGVYAEVAEEALIDGNDLALAVQDQDISIHGLFDRLDEGVLGNNAGLLFKDAGIGSTRRREIG
jgi:hypothetical protein